MNISALEGIRGISKVKGDISELSVQLELIGNGLRVLKPIGDNYPYDLVFEYNGNFFKVQVKTGTLQSNGCIIASLRSSHVTTGKKFTNQKYDVSEVDIFAIHSIEFNVTCYVINKGNMRSFSFIVNNDNKKFNSNLAEDYSLGKLLSTL